MTNRWALAVIVCAAAFTCHRYLDWPSHQHHNHLRNKRVELPTENITYPEYDNVHYNQPQQPLHKVNYLGDDVYVEPSVSSRNQFLTPNELFLAPLNFWRLSIRVSKEKMSDDLVEQAHFDLDRSILPRLLIGQPEKMPIVSTGMSNQKVSCIGAMLWMQRSNWTKELACKQKLEIRVRDQYGHLIESHSTMVGEKSRELGQLQLTSFTILTPGSSEKRPLKVAATLIPLAKNATRKGLEDLLARKKMSFDHFRVVGHMEQFGFFINASIILRNPIDPDYAVHMHCWGGLFMAAGTRGRPFEPSDASQQSAGYFNLGQYGKAEVPLMIRKLDYYLGQGVKNSALIVSLPEFSCKLLGDDFLMSALNSSLALVLKPFFPYISFEQNLENIKGIAIHLRTSVSQSAGPRHSERKPQYKTRMQMSFTNELANFTNVFYLRVINTPASSLSSYFQPSDAIEPRPEKPAATCEGDDCMFSDPNQCTTPDVVDGLSFLLVQGLFHVNVAVNFTQTWSDSHKRHHIEIYTYGDKHSKRQRAIERQSNPDLPENPRWTSANRRLDNVTQILASVEISDNRKADLTIIHFNLVKEWRTYLKELLDLNRESGQQRALNRLKLPQIERHADRSEQVLLDRDLDLGPHELRLQERLQRCSTDSRLVEMPVVGPQINCLPDGEDNDLYARQLLVRKINGEKNFELACYPLKREVVIERIQRGLVRLNAVNGLISSRRLEGFVQDYLKLGAHCTMKWKNSTGFDEAVTLRLNMVVAINETTSSLQKETDGDDHDTLVDQWNWLLEAIFSGRISNGLMIDQTIQIDVRLDSLLGAYSPTLTTGLNSSLLLQDSFPYVTYASGLSEGSLFTVLGTVNQTCYDKPVQEEEYQFLDLKTGINSILLSNEHDPARQYSFDSITRTSCAVYNTSYLFFGSYLDLEPVGGFMYQRTVRVNASVANATESDETSNIFLKSHGLFMGGSGREEANKNYHYKCNWVTMEPEGSMFFLDMNQKARPEDTDLQSFIVVGKEYIYIFLEMIRENLDRESKKRGPINTVELIDSYEYLAELQAKIKRLKASQAPAEGVLNNSTYNTAL